MLCSQAPPVYGGAGTQALALAGALTRHGIEAEVLTQNQMRTAGREVLSGVLVRRAPGEAIARLLPRRLGQVCRTLTFALWLSFRFSRERYDVYHVHGGYWFALVPACFARLRGVPLIIKVTRLGEDDAETVHAKKLAGVPVGWLYSLPFRSADAVIAVNTEIAARHRERLPAVELHEVPNGVDVDRFACTPARRRSGRRRLGVRDDALVALFVGYLAPHKGVAELLEAWPRVIERASSDRPHALVFVGPAVGFYRELADDLSKMALSIDGPSLRILEHVETDVMPELYAAADVFVLPTRAEGMPNSLLEALAAGLPVVASRIPGVTEVVAAALGGGALLDDLDPEAIASALISAFGQADAAADQSPRRSVVPASLSLTTVAATYSALYERLTAQRRVTKPLFEGMHP